LLPCLSSHLLFNLTFNSFPHSKLVLGTLNLLLSFPLLLQLFLKSLFDRSPFPPRPKVFEVGAPKRPDNSGDNSEPSKSRQFFDCGSECLTNFWIIYEVVRARFSHHASMHALSAKKEVHLLLYWIQFEVHLTLESILLSCSHPLLPVLQMF
jgi:hypothetical protein